MFDHIGRLPNDAGDSIKPGFCKERMRLPANSLDEAYITWQALENGDQVEARELGY